MNNCAELSVHRQAGVAPSLFLNLFDRLQQWRDRTRQRQALAALDDRQLRDIGLSRADIEQEYARPFWR